jgi:hypothetical protein
MNVVTVLIHLPFFRKLLLWPLLTAAILAGTFSVHACEAEDRVGFVSAAEMLAAETPNVSEGIVPATDSPMVAAAAFAAFGPSPQQR